MPGISGRFLPPRPAKLPEFRTENRFRVIRVQNPPRIEPLSRENYTWRSIPLAAFNPLANS
jgi:hypothetical protein